MAGRELKSGRGLHIQLADSLRERLRQGEWKAGERLPTEAQLTAEYRVSRSTVRAALQLLETQGRTKTRHGIGTFVTPFGREIKTGLQELQSMSETIRAHGLEPEMEYHSAFVRSATVEEAADLQCAVGVQVFATERAVLADGDVVAFSYDAIPLSVLPSGFDPSTVTGSLFRLLESHHILATTAVAEIHATRGRSIGWGERMRGAAYLLLDQVHYTSDGNPVLASKTYFLEGRFQFSVLRIR
ncbi:MAG: GntR family transcriptional regulator [Actinomycetota bacterium]|nr:GntR family transcriptional regulator [Actinomycetota bacterium]